MSIASPNISSLGQHVGVIGLGKTGLSAVKFLKAQGFHVTVFDTRENPPGLEDLKQIAPEVSLHVGDLPVEILKTVDSILLSPGLSPHHPSIETCEKQGIFHVSDIELFSYFHKGSVLGITGSNGKSTVTMLTAHLLKGAGVPSKMGGNIGIPVLELLPTEKKDTAVLELSSFQLDSTESLRCDVACILNITPDHMDRYDSFEDYVHSKHRIYKHCHTAVINRDEANTFPQDKNITLLTYGLSQPKEGEYGIVYEEGIPWICFGKEKIINTRNMKLVGKHNWINVMASLAMIHQFAIPTDTLQTLVADFTGLPYRCEWRREINQVKWYNDSKGTNVGATLAAIAGLAEENRKNIILIAGGQGKGADFAYLQEAVSKYVKAAILYGEDASHIEKGIKNHTTIYRENSLEQAVLLAHKESKPGDIVLFSPACASFDMFKNFEHRGEVFNQLVKELTS